jgi:hypothetical protein
MDNVDNLIIEHLRPIRAEIAAVKDDVRELKTRCTSVEHGQGTILQQLGHIASMLAVQQAGHDRLTDRAERLERRTESTTRLSGGGCRGRYPAAAGSQSTTCGHAHSSAANATMISR